MPRSLKMSIHCSSATSEGLAQDTKKHFWENIKIFKIRDNSTKYGFLKGATHFTGNATHICLKHSGNILIFDLLDTN